MIHTNMNITHFSFIYSDRNNCYANIWFPNRFNFSNWLLFRKWDPCTVMIVNIAWIKDIFKEFNKYHYYSLCRPEQYWLGWALIV